jgi:hypothetical protein
MDYLAWITLPDPFYRTIDIAKENILKEIAIPIGHFDFVTPFNLSEGS